MVRFGKVAGIVFEAESMLLLTVTLETGQGISEIRHEQVRRLCPEGDQAALDWQADQYTQETIGVDLGERGWEAIADAPSEPDTITGIGRSRIYTVRNLGWGAV